MSQGFSSHQVLESVAAPPSAIEEGNFTPTLSNIFLTDFGMTYSAQKGRYTRIGKRVDFIINLQVTNLGSYTVGDLVIRGLPYNVAFGADWPDYPPVIFHGPSSGLTITAGHVPTGYVDVNSTDIVLEIWNATTGTSPLDETHIGSTPNLRLSGWYWTDAA